MINFLLPIMVFAPIVMGFAPLFIKDLKKLNDKQLDTIANLIKEIK